VTDQHEPADILTVTADAEQMQPLAKDPDAMSNKIGLLLILGLICFLGFGVAYWQDATFWVYGTLLGAGLVFLGAAFIAWGKYLLPKGPFVEERHVLASSEQERSAFAAALMERGVAPIKRRKALGALLGGTLGAFSIVALFPLVRSLGPLPGDSLATTNWKKGIRLVDINGNVIHVDQMTVGSFATVFPEGLQLTDEGQAIDQTFLIRVDTEAFTTIKGRENWTPQGYVAYSKLCTHLGCPVGLYEQQLEVLVCPCHQSMFNVREGAMPTFGPAPRPLPQLPLAVDSDGHLIAAAGYNEPVGPGYWERP
jgi:ubiquinol-cytochrome c reductase iron-sulfur subunit